MLYMLALFGIFMLTKGQTSIDVLSDCSMPNWTIVYTMNMGLTYCQTCGSYTIYGRETFQTFIKSYLLSSHNKITIKAEIWSSKQLSDNNFYIVADNQIAIQTNFNESLGEIGDCGNVFQATIEITINHKCSSLIVQFYPLESMSWWAIKEYEFLIHETEEEQFFEGTCYLLLSKLYEEISLMNETTINGWQLNGLPYSSLYTVYYFWSMGPIDPTNINILQKTFSITEDSFIQIQFKLIYYLVLDFTVQVLRDGVKVHEANSLGFYVDLYKTPLIQQSQKDIVVAINISYGQQFISFSSCSVGFRDFKLAQYTKKSDKSCADGTQYIYTGSQIDQFSIQEGCNNLINGICINCKDGWTFDQDICYLQCGDSIITNNEECDDGNKLEFDGCHQCKFSCPLNCENCQFGQCKQCKNQYSWINNKCEIILTDFNLSIKVFDITIFL